MATNFVFKKMQEAISKKLQDVLEKTLSEKGLFYSTNPSKTPSASDVDSVISNAANTNSLIFGKAGLLIGPLGMLSVVPEVVLIIRNEIGLIYDVAKAHGKSDLVSKEVVVSILLSGFGTPVDSLVTTRGGKYLAKFVSSQDYKNMVVLLSGKVAQQLLKSTVSKYLPKVGPAAMAAWTNYTTRKIGKRAHEVFGSELLIEEVKPPQNSSILFMEETNKNSMSVEDFDYFRFKMLTNLAKIDGCVDRSEVQFIVKMMEKSSLDKEQKVEVLKKLHDPSADVLGIEQLSQYPDDAIALLADMTALAKQDNDLHVTERLYVRRIGSLLGFREDEVDEVLMGC